MPRKLVATNDRNVLMSEELTAALEAQESGQRMSFYFIINCFWFGLVFFLC